MKLGITILILSGALMAQAPRPGPAVFGGLVTREFTPVQNAGTDVICAKAADTITGLTCNNTVLEAPTAIPFTTVATIPAGTLGNTTIKVNLVIGNVFTGTTPTVTLSLFYGGASGTEIFRSGVLAPSSGSSVYDLAFLITAAGASSASTPVIVSCIANNLAANTLHIGNVLITNTALSVAADTTTSKTLVVKVAFSANTAGNALWLYAIAP